MAVINWHFESKDTFLFPCIIHGKNDIDKIQSKLKKLNLITDGKRLNFLYPQKNLLLGKFDYLWKI